jgi:hypothetical protein
VPANRERGELEVVSNGQPFTWRLTMNALCALEGRTGQKLLELLTAVDAFSAHALRDVVWAALQDHHAADVPTPEAAGDFIDGMGGTLAAFVKVRELLELNQPTSGNPQTPAGSGDDSMWRVAASA